MKLKKTRFWALVGMALLLGQRAVATIEGSLDPSSVVAQWSNSSTYPKIIDIDFSDESWPDTWKGKTSVDCPAYSSGGYVNLVVDVPANGGTTIGYPVLFHNCTFANRLSASGLGGATAAFARQYYLGQKACGNSASNMNNWTVAGHTTYLEDNIQYGSDGKPTRGEAGFVQMCRDAAVKDEAGNKVSQHGWMEIDHIPYVERVQWSWSSTAWGRGIKCDYKIGDGDWKPLVWMGSEKHKLGYTAFSDQGYFMENVINASDVSIRWRVWDGEDPNNPVQQTEQGGTVFTKGFTPYDQQQAPRVHKVQIFGSEITAAQAQYAKEHPVSDVGTLSDIGGGSADEKTAPDANAPIVLFTVAQDGSGDYRSIQAAIDAVPTGTRGIIYVRKGVYEENIYAGTKENKNKFVSLIGEDRDNTILTSSVSRGAGHEDNTYNDCAALNVYTPCFYAENLTIRNTSGNVGQAEALFTNGDAHVFNNCLLSGYQDTYKANTGSRGYFTNCTIEGATDFIYDGGMEWFDRCELRCLKGGGYITAPAETSMPMTRVLYPELSQTTFYPGLFFRHCSVTAAEGVADGAYYLGRPWKERCGAMFMQCRLGSHINARGWKEWGGTENTSSLYEYKNTNADGTLADVSKRAAFSCQATDAEAAAYMTPEFMFKKFSDVPFDYEKILRGAAAPMNFVVIPTEISWEGDDNTAGYIVYKDGAFCQFTTAPQLKKAEDDDARYTFSSVSRQGVVSKPVAPADAQRIKAFPTAEGFGKYATGGRGGKVVTVTSLADDGSAGTLRWAFQQYPGEPVTIVFAVSGDITLRSDLRVNRADWTLAGQTAPGEGIVVTHNKVNLGGSQNFIVRNMRFRIGQKDVNGKIQMENALGAENCSNFIFDHCVFGWSVEENMNTADSHFLTVQNSMVHEGLYNAGHSKGARGYGCQWGGSPASYYRNLLANNNSRSPRFNGARGEDYVVFIEYINNVNFNFGGSGGCYGGENTADITSYNGLNSAHECNFINNYYRPNMASSKTGIKFVKASYARNGATSWAPSKWYVDGNVIEGDLNSEKDNWKAMEAEHYKLSDIKADSRIRPEHAYYKYSLSGNIGNYDPDLYMIYDYLPASEVLYEVTHHAGTVNRDKIEQRVANSAWNGDQPYGGTTKGKNSGIIDTENDAEGFITYSTDYTVPTDTDGDGMPDEWEKVHGLDPDKADQNLLNPDGYTALEVYLNSLMGEILSDQFTAGISGTTLQQPALRYDRTTATLYVGENAVGGRLKIYTTDGKLIGQQRILSAATPLITRAQGVLLLKVEHQGLTSRIVKVVR